MHGKFKLGVLSERSEMDSPFFDKKLTKTGHQRRFRPQYMSDRTGQPLILVTQEEWENVQRLLRRCYPEATVVIADIGEAIEL